MAGTFPTLSGGTTWMYPLRVKYSCLTRVHRATNSAEQRYVVRAPMVEIDATYTNLNAADVTAIQTFHDSQKGAFDSTWTIAGTFTGMRFMSDELRWEERIPNRFSTRLQMRGFHPAIISPPSTLPPLPSGAVTQRPWSKRRTFETNYIDLESGVRRALALRGGGFTNWPTVPELAWDLQFPICTDAFVADLILFFLSKNGRFGSFSFTDPDTLVAYTDCFFASDDLDVAYNGFNRCATSVTIIKP